MSNAELAKDIIVSLIGSQHTTFYADTKTASEVAEAYEIIFNKINNLNK